MIKYNIDVVLSSISNIYEIIRISENFEQKKKKEIFENDVVLI